MKLLDLYKSLLKVASMEVSEGGHITTKRLESSSPTMVGGKRLVLPTPEHLSKASSEIVMFHPLSENMMRDSSVVLDAYRTAVNVNLNYTIGVLVYELLIIASSPGMHSNLTPDQAEFLSIVKNADDKTLEVFGKLLSKMPASQQKDVFINIYLKRGGLVNGKKYQRVGIVTFPFYSELKKDGDVYGIKLRVKDKETYISLLEYIFPQINEPEAYNVGTNTKIAPNIEALMKTILGIGSAINDQVNLFSSVMDKSDNLLIDSDWVETFENLEVIKPQINLIPPQAGNEGTPINSVQQSIPVPPVQNAMPYQNVIQPVPAPMPYQNVQAPVQVVPGVVSTPGGLDFSSLSRVVPSLMPQQNMYPQGQVMNNGQGRLPGWATPTQPAYAPPLQYQQPQGYLNPIYQQQPQYQPPQQYQQPYQQQYQQPQQNNFYNTGSQINHNI